MVQGVCVCMQVVCRSDVMLMQYAFLSGTELKKTVDCGCSDVAGVITCRAWIASKEQAQVPRGHSISCMLQASHSIIKVTQRRRFRLLRRRRGQRSMRPYPYQGLPLTLACGRGLQRGHCHPWCHHHLCLCHFHPALAPGPGLAPRRRCRTYQAGLETVFSGG